MGMTIDEAIGELQKLKLPISKHDLSFHFVEHTRNETLDMAIDTMRKYQKIEDLVNDCADESVDDTSCCARYIGLIEEIIYTEEQEDGNNN